MTGDDIRELTEGLEALSVRYPRIEIGEETILGYVQDLRDLPLVAVLAAMEVLRQTSRFFPTVAEIREAVAELVIGDEMLPETAWAEVQREVQRIGYRPLPVFHAGVFTEQQRTFSSPLIAAAVDAVGWDLICLASEEDGRFVRDQFIKTISAIRGRDVSRIQRGGGGLVSIGELGRDRGHRALRYNVHTTSTGGMGNAIRAAHAKWQDAIHDGRIPDTTDGATL